MKKFIEENWFKIITIIILIGAFWNHPYFYYQILRWFTAVSSAYLAYKYSQIERIGWMWTFVVLAILFNPILPFYMSKGSWQIFDLIGAVIFAISIFIKNIIRNKNGNN
jgi:FtsH-binding integral membrane protein